MTAKLYAKCGENCSLQHSHFVMCSVSPPTLFSIFMLKKENLVLWLGCLRACVCKKSLLSVCRIFAQIVRYYGKVKILNPAGGIPGLHYRQNLWCDVVRVFKGFKLYIVCAFILVNIRTNTRKQYFSRLRSETHMAFFVQLAIT